MRYFNVEVSSAHFFDQKCSTNSKIMKYYYNLKELFSISIYFKMSFIAVIKAVFYSSLQCHMILQKSFWFADLLLKKTDLKTSQQLLPDSNAKEWY